MAADRPSAKSELTALEEAILLSHPDGNLGPTVGVAGHPISQRTSCPMDLPAPNGSIEADEMLVLISTKQRSTTPDAYTRN
jgi:hypothetical protein